MDRSTTLALNRVNRIFYLRHAGDFDAKRSAPWPGWGRLLEGWAAHGRPPRPRILDVGCGNARFGLRAARELSQGFRYVGLDGSPALLAVAAERLAVLGEAVDAELYRWDLVAAALPGRPLELPVAGSFDLVVAFGLLHHVPGLELRCRLLAALGRRLAPGGLLAASLWRFGDRPRFRRRVVPWGTAGNGPAIDPARVEAGDHLLRWGTGDALRYCHAASEQEEEALAAAPALGGTVEMVGRFDADGAAGDLNRYLLWRRS